MSGNSSCGSRCVVCKPDRQHAALPPPFPMVSFDDGMGHLGSQRLASASRAHPGPFCRKPDIPPCSHSQHATLPFPLPTISFDDGMGRLGSRWLASVSRALPGPFCRMPDIPPCSHRQHAIIPHPFPMVSFVDGIGRLVSRWLANVSRAPLGHFAKCLISALPPSSARNSSAPIPDGKI